MVGIKKWILELDGGMLDSVSGGTGSGNSGCYEPCGTICFKVSCPVCGRQCDGNRDMLQIQVDHCGSSVVQWINNR